MSIRFKLEGFEDLLHDIEAANGSVNAATESAMRESAQIMQDELISQMTSSGVPNDLIKAMPNYDIEKNGNRITARVGYKKGTYNPDDISDGYKVVFLNFGTPKRKEHGQIKKRGFIRKAKNKARPKIKKAQEEVLQKILARLKK